MNWQSPKTQNILGWLSKWLNGLDSPQPLLPFTIRAEPSPKHFRCLPKHSCLPPKHGRVLIALSFIHLFSSIHNHRQLLSECFQKLSVWDSHLRMVSCVFGGIFRAGFGHFGNWKTNRRVDKWTTRKTIALVVTWSRAIMIRWAIAK